ncbi:hypothetical protein RJ640_024458 [Escallonia rubra]|uniref:Uncharacterized protein n=1 Tax=Escallonia rubra TaxID=112253 RepID=A0AA88UQ15_9ASTE|nr:hypothetical protein RJ640_024458 [Escallonia rubra]
MLNLGHNSLTGKLPNSISNASKLTHLDLFANNFSGIVPDSLGNLELLELLNLGDNNFINEPSSPELSFITSLTNCKKLRVLSIDDNPIAGTLPVSIGNLSASLQKFYAYRCRIRGTIPNVINNLSSLIALSLYGNDLSGSIPNTIKGLQKLQEIGVQENKLRRCIPNRLRQLPNLNGLYLYTNQLSGPVPACLSNISSLRELVLSSNKLTARIPASLGNLKDLLRFDASFNSLHGSLPSEIGNLKVVTLLNISYNNLSGDIPGSIGDLQNLVNLSLGNNELMGTIPETFQSLVSLEIFDFSHYNLSGVIPKSLDKLLYLKYFNVAYNNLHGEIPSGGPFGHFTSQSFLPNEALCGATQFGVRPCKTNSVGRMKTLKKVVIICVSSVIPLIVLLFTFVLLWIRCQKSKKLPIEIDLQPVAGYRRITHQEILEATDGFDESNLLEYGLGGSVARSCDVYSYGIMLMETFTGKKPTAEMFAEHMNLKCWVMESLPSAVIQVIDRNLLRQEGENSFADVDCVTSILMLAVDCAAESPEQRIDMKDVLASLKKIKGKRVAGRDCQWNKVVLFHGTSVHLVG